MRNSFTYKNYTVIIIFLVFFSSCSTKKKSWVHRQYHNTTAKFNGYFNGNESLKEGIKKLKNNHKDNYTNILPIFKTGDLTKAKTASFATSSVNEVSIPK